MNDNRTQINMESFIRISKKYFKAEDIKNIVEKGHIGILTPKFFNDFKEKYSKNIIEVKYFDNKNYWEMLLNLLLINHPAILR